MAARGPKTIDPSPQEIVRRTARIREGWTERTFRMRAGWSVDAADRMDQWVAPLIRLSEAEEFANELEHHDWQP